MGFSGSGFSSSGSGFSGFGFSTQPYIVHTHKDWYIARARSSTSQGIKLQVGARVAVDCKLTNLATKLISWT